MPTQEDIDWNNIVSKNQRAETRRERQVEKDVKDRRKSLLRGASSTRERRDIKAGVYDLSTRPDDNKEGIDERIQNDGIDRITSPIQDGSGSDGNVEFNGSVLICINGDPYYIDIPYDSETGPYAPISGANFPITAP
jgi:hypothetical protein